MGVLGGPAAALAVALTTILGLVAWLVRWIVRTLRAGYDERVADLRAHQTETVDILKQQIATGQSWASSLERILTGQETTQRLVEALPVRTRDAA